MTCGGRKKKTSERVFFCWQKWKGLEAVAAAQPAVKGPQRGDSDSRSVKRLRGRALRVSRLKNQFSRLFIYDNIKVQTAL